MVAADTLLLNREGEWTGFARPLEAKGGGWLAMLRRLEKLARLDSLPDDALLEVVD